MTVPESEADRLYREHYAAIVAAGRALKAGNLSEAVAILRRSGSTDPCSDLRPLRRNLDNGWLAEREREDAR